MRVHKLVLSNLSGSGLLRTANPSWFASLVDPKSNAWRSSINRLGLATWLILRPTWSEIFFRRRRTVHDLSHLNCICKGLPYNGSGESLMDRSVHHALGFLPFRLGYLFIERFYIVCNGLWSKAGLWSTGSNCKLSVPPVGWSYYYASWFLIQLLLGEWSRNLSRACDSHLLHHEQSGYPS